MVQVFLETPGHPTRTANHSGYASSWVPYPLFHSFLNVTSGTCGPIQKQNDSVILFILSPQLEV